MLVLVLCLGGLCKKYKKKTDLLEHWMFQHLLLEDASLWEKQQKKVFCLLFLWMPVISPWQGYLLFLQEMTPAKKTKFQLFPAFLAVYKKVPLIKEIRPAESKQMFFPGLQCWLKLLWEVVFNCIFFFYCCSSLISFCQLICTLKSVCAIDLISFSLLKLLCANFNIYSKFFSSVVFTLICSSGFF